MGFAMDSGRSGEQKQKSAAGLIGAVRSDKELRMGRLAGNRGSSRKRQWELCSQSIWKGAEAVSSSGQRQSMKEQIGVTRVPSIVYWDKSSPVYTRESSLCLLERLRVAVKMSSGEGKRSNRLSALPNGS